MPTYIPQMSTHTLDGLKAWPKADALDIDGTLSSSINLNSVGATVYSGCCVHVDSVASSGLGTGTTNNVPIPVFKMGAKTGQMPIFLWVGSDGYDVSNPGVPAGVALGGTTTYPPDWIPIRPTGKVMGLVATGGYELETTEFDTAQTYAPNDLLRAVTSDTDANGGKLTNQNAATNQTFTGGTGVAVWAPNAASDSIVGVCSRGSYTNKNNRPALAFWPVYLPGSR